MSEEIAGRGVDSLQQRLPPESVLEAQAYASPEGAQHLLTLLRIKIDEVVALKQELVQAKTEISGLTNEREDLKIRVAQLSERVRVSWLEAAFGILGGMGLAAVMADVGSGQGWALIVVSAILILWTKIGPSLRPKNEDQSTRDD